MWLVTKDSIINMDQVSSIRILNDSEVEARFPLPQSELGGVRIVRADGPTEGRIILKEGNLEECQEFFDSLLAHMRSSEPTDFIMIEYLE